MKSLVVAAAALALGAGCGGKVVVGIEGQGGGGGTSVSSGSGSGSVTVGTGTGVTSTGTTGTSTTSSAMTTGPQVCQPGESMTYPCDNCPGQGIATCKADGSGWDYQPCDCPSCTTCGDYLQNGGADLCPQSAPLYDALVTCVCQGACAMVCADTVCQGGQSDSCFNCIQDPNGCGDELNACFNDM